VPVFSKPHLYLAFAIALSSACASIEKGRYGVQSVRIDGAKQLSGARVRTCLLTRERNSFGLTVGILTPNCDRPPFDESIASVALWRWPWTEWPIFNKAVLDKDADRVVRWYRARGFYQAKVVELRIDPPDARWPGAATRDAKKPGAAAACDPEKSACAVSITIVVDEGKPVLVERITLNIHGSISEELRRSVQAAIPLSKGKRFDEYDYDSAKPLMLSALKNASFADAKLTAYANIDTTKRTAEVVYNVEVGPPFKFGTISVSGQGPLSTAPILAATGLTTDTRYSPARVAEAKREVLALGSFAAVAIEEKLDVEHSKVNLQIQITRPDRNMLRLGVGMQSGTSQRGTDTAQSVPQWDLHLLTQYTYRNPFNTLGTFQIDERPRIIFNDTFPAATNPSFGNILGATINQPGLIEARTNLVLTGSWDYGPDPYLDFQRSDVSVRLSADRWFFSRHLELELAVEQDLYVVPQTDNTTSTGMPPPSSYNISLLGQKIGLSTRDNIMRPTRGFYILGLFSQAPRWAGSDWTAFFFRPEARIYVPLPFDTVFAARFAIGWTIITNASSKLDETSQKLGPSVYRLRGGGADSVRGFAAGELGAGIQGGLTRWEAMIETRVPLGTAFEVAALLDFGDVSVDAFNFAHLNTSLGFGFRLHSPIGAIRLDTAFRVMALQNIGGPKPEVPDDQKLFGSVPGAIHFTIGDAF
jgi:outer membrane protein assembly factor BamA